MKGYGGVSDEGIATGRDMRFEASMTLEERIKLLATELERTRSDLRER